MARPRPGGPFLAIHECSCLQVAVGKSHDPMTVPLPMLAMAFVHIAVGMVLDPMALLPSIHEQAFLYITVGKVQDPLTVLFFNQVLAFVA